MIKLNLLMLLLVVLVHSENQKVVEVRAELGQNITLTCSFSHPETFWYMEVSNGSRLGIGRTYVSAFSTFSSPDFESRYSLVENRLVIRNFSVEDSGLYFCSRKMNGRMSGGDFIRLLPGKPECCVDVSSAQVECSSRV